MQNSPETHDPAKAQEQGLTRHDLQGLRQRLLAPRKIERVGGWLSHPALPLCDEDVRYDALLAAFGLDTAYVTLEDQDEVLFERYFDEGTSLVAQWEPQPPQGEGWVLLEIFDTEEGPTAMYVREAAPRRRRA